MVAALCPPDPPPTAVAFASPVMVELLPFAGFVDPCPPRPPAPTVIVAVFAGHDSFTCIVAEDVFPPPPPPPAKLVPAPPPPPPPTMAMLTRV